MRVGYHFSFLVMPAWRNLVDVFDQRARERRHAPLGAALTPKARRVGYSGTLDQRLARGSLRYDVVSYDERPAVLGLVPGRSEGELRFDFGVTSVAERDEEPLETCSFDRLGLFLPEERSFGMGRDLPRVQLCQLNLWDIAEYFADAEVGLRQYPPSTGGGPFIAEYASLPMAQDFRLSSEGRRTTAWTLAHQFVSIVVEVTPLVPR